MIPLALIGEAVLVGLVLLGCAAYFGHQFSKSGSAAEIGSGTSRIVITAALLVFAGMAFKLTKPGAGPTGLFAVLIAVIVVGVLLAIMWLPSLIQLILGPMLGSMTGGEEKVELKPVYFRAIGLRKRGDYVAAVAAVRAELAKFPGNAEGLMLLVDLQAEDLKDPRAGLGTLQELLATPGRDGGERAVALSRKADLQLKGLNDPDGARETLATLVAEFPDSPAGHLAQQRLAHLPESGPGGEKPEPVRLVVTHHEERLGLTDDLGASRLPVEDATRTARELVQHLAQFPDDWEARERLARLYADPLGHLGLATEQLEQLIAQPGVSARHVVRWFNEMADLQLKTEDGIAAARLTLERLVSRFPDSPWATQAEGRLRHLFYDQRAKEATRTIKLGQYEQRLGLKRGDPSIPDPAGPQGEG